MPVVGDTPPFNTGQFVSRTQEEVSAIFGEFGWTRWADVFTVGDDVKAEDLRPARYSTPDEALIDMYDRGLIGFTRIYYIADEDLYSIVIAYDE